MLRKSTTSVVTFSALMLLCLSLIICTHIFVTHNHQAAHPAALKNGSFFINPITPLNSLPIQTKETSPLPQLRGKWILMYFNNASCLNHQCDPYLHTMLIVENTLKKNQHHLTRLWLQIASHPEQIIPNSDTQLQLMHIDDKTTLTANYFYIVDPFGNLILRYENNTSPQTILLDLQYLMRASKMGYRHHSTTKMIASHPFLTKKQMREAS